MSWEIIRKAAKNKKLVPFFGAGLSANIGLPTWNHLMEDIGTATGYDPPELILTLGDNLQIAEYFVALKKSYGPLTSLLGKKLSCPDFTHAGWSVYQSLFDWDPPLIYTTNFDESIEAFYRQNGRNPNVISKVDHLREVNPKETTIIKFHGDLNYPEELVITESQYVQRMDLESPLDLRLRSDLLQNTFIFMGYSFHDFNVRVIWHKLRHLLDPYRTTYAIAYESYFLSSRSNPIFDEVMKPKGLEVLQVDVSELKDLIPTCIKEITK